jgi:hypothetical protein
VASPHHFFAAILIERLSKPLLGAQRRDAAFNFFQPCGVQLLGLLR